MNTQPSTVFGIWLYRKGLWHSRAEDTFKALFEMLSSREQDAAVKASGIIAIINESIDKTPDEIFELIQLKFPDVTKEHLHGWLNAVLALINKVDSLTGATIEETLQNIVQYLESYKGTEQWAIEVQRVVALFTMVIAPYPTSTSKILTILEYVYQSIVKTWLEDIIKGILIK